MFRISLKGLVVAALCGGAAWAQETYTVLTTLTGEFGQLFVGVDPVANKVYVPLRQTGGIRVYNGTTHALVQVIPAPPNVAESFDAEAGPGLGRMWVSTCESKLNPRICQRILVFDDTTETLLATVTGQEFGTLELNPATTRLYAASHFGTDVTVIDGNTNAILATIPIGAPPQEIAANPVTNRIYVAAFPGVVVVDGATNVIITTITVGGVVAGVAVNPVTNRIYVSAETGVVVVDGATHTILTTIPFVGNGGGIEVNSKTNRIFVPTTPTPGSLHVVDGVTNSVIATVPVGGTPAEVEVNEASNRIYVAVFDGFVTVIEGSVVPTTPSGMLLPLTSPPPGIAQQPPATPPGQDPGFVPPGQTNTKKMVAVTDEWARDTGAVVVGPNPARAGAPVQVSFTSKWAQVETDCRVYTVRGELVCGGGGQGVSAARAVTSSAPGSALGRYAVTWEGADDQGTPVPSGAYLIQLSVRDPLTGATETTYRKVLVVR